VRTAKVAQGKGLEQEVSTCVLSRKVDRRTIPKDLCATFRRLAGFANDQPEAVPCVIHQLWVNSTREVREQEPRSAASALAMWIVLWDSSRSS